MWSESSILPDQTLGGYRLLRQIGEGGMGVVHVAAAPNGDRVAVKILRPQLLADRDARARLEREVAAMRRIRSPRVAECIDADPWGATPYVVTRFVPGIPLNEYRSEYGPLSPYRIHAIAAGMAEALAGVHAAGVLHRDIKPSNVLMERDQPVLIDFGLALAADQSRLTYTGWLLGTPSYLAPELVLGREPTQAVDIHSWAATVAFAATGRSPYGGGPAVAVMDRIRRGEWSLDGVPASLRPILEPCLSQDPAQRPSATQLCEWLAATPPDSATPPPEPPTRPVTVPIASPAPPATPSAAAPVAAPAAVTPAAAAAPSAAPPAAPPDPAFRHPRLARAMRIVGAVLAAAMLAGAMAIAPYVVAAVAAGLVMIGSAVARSRNAWSWPWHAILALPKAVFGAALGLIVMLTLIAVLVVLGAQVRETMVVGGGAFAFMMRVWPGFEDARDSLRRLGRWLIQPTPPGAVALVFIAAGASGMIAAALATGPHWWPFDHEPWFGWGWRLG